MIQSQSSNFSEDSFDVHDWTWNGGLKFLGSSSRANRTNSSAQMPEFKAYVLNYFIGNENGIPGWPEMQIILCTRNCHTKNSLWLCHNFFVFFSMAEYGSTGIILWQTMTSILFLNFFAKRSFQFLIYIVSSNTKVLKLRDLPIGPPVSNFQSLTFPVIVRIEKLSSFVLVCSTLRHCELYFSEMGFHKIFLILGNQK